MGTNRICCTRNNNSNQHNKIKKITIKPITKSKILFINQMIYTYRVNNLAKYCDFGPYNNLKNDFVKINRDYKNIQIKTFKN